MMAPASSIAPSVKERLSLVQRKLVTIEAAVSGSETLDFDSHERAILATELAETASMAAVEVYWILHNCPASVLNAAAPTDDEREEIAQLKKERVSA